MLDRDAGSRLSQRVLQRALMFGHTWTKHVEPFWTLINMDERIGHHFFVYKLVNSQQNTKNAIVQKFGVNTFIYLFSK